MYAVEWYDAYMLLRRQKTEEHALLLIDKEQQLALALRGYTEGWIGGNKPRRVRKRPVGPTFKGSAEQWLEARRAKEEKRPRRVSDDEIRELREKMFNDV